MSDLSSNNLEHWNLGCAKASGLNDSNVSDRSLAQRAFVCALAFSGETGSQGTIVARNASICAFGPQKLPLNDPKGFGIRPVQEHRGRWASPIASPEVWYALDVSLQETSVSLALSFFGLESAPPLAFSFYVRARSACVGSTFLEQKSLRRYEGPSHPVLFGENLFLKTSCSTRLSVIPLAGKGSFWDADYLAAFELQTAASRIFYLTPKETNNVIF